MFIRCSPLLLALVAVLALKTLELERGNYLSLEVFYFYLFIYLFSFYMFVSLFLFHYFRD